MSNVGVPLLGSKISLISKSEIRYEGILYAIDTKESTVALAKVKSFGTEDRHAERNVAPRDEVHEYIIFRASEIKDLQVSEVPLKPQQATSSFISDPAIVQHSPQYTVPCGQAYAAVCGIPAYQHYSAQPNYSSIPTYIPSGHVSGSSRSTTPTSSRKSPTSDAGVQVSVSDNSDASSKGSREQIKRPRENMQNVMQSQQMMSNRRGQFRRRGAPRRGWGRGRGGSNYTRDVLRFDNEYDFEQANAEFQELETKLAKAKLVTDELAKTDSETVDDDAKENIGTYDREKSFFDDISCDSSQRGKGLPRFDWRVERRLNVETFGVSMSNNWFRRRRSRGGGFRRGYNSRGGFNRNQPENQKTVTFDDKLTIKEVDIIDTVEALETVESPKPEKIPVIELVVEKEKTDWPENSNTDPAWEVSKPN